MRLSKLQKNILWQMGQSRTDYYELRQKVFNVLKKDNMNTFKVSFSRAVKTLEDNKVINRTKEGLRCWKELPPEFIITDKKLICYQCGKDIREGQMFKVERYKTKTRAYCFRCSQPKKRRALGLNEHYNRRKAEEYRNHTPLRNWLKSEDGKQHQAIDEL